MALILILAPVLLLAWMVAAAMSTPVVRTSSVGLIDWPSGAPPIKVVLISDIHVAGPDMPPSRLAAIVTQINRLRPGVVLIAGDFVSDKRVATKHYPARIALEPLRGLQPSLASVAVFGNHDHWRGTREIAEALSAAKVGVLVNDAMTLGPLRIGGTDDDFTGHADVRTTVARMRAGPGAKVLLSHSPDVTPRVPSDVGLILAGHTHCGQVRLPVIGAVSYMSRFGNQYACGEKKDHKRRIITSAGVGTSVLPIRLGAAPDIWLLTLGPARS